MISVNVLLTYLFAVSASYPLDSTYPADVYGSRSSPVQHINPMDRIEEVFDPLKQS